MTAAKTEAQQETKKTTKTKRKTKEPAREWRTDRPTKPGLYNCRIGSLETPLQFKRCQFSGRSYWLYVDGTDVDPNAAVEWRPGKIRLG